MRKTIVALILNILLLMPCMAQAQQRDWENPHVLGINKLPYHATLQLPSRESECIAPVSTSLLRIDAEALHTGERAAYEDIEILTE